MNVNFNPYCSSNWWHILLNVNCTCTRAYEEIATVRWTIKVWFLKNTNPKNILSNVKKYPTLTVWKLSSCYSSEIQLCLWKNPAKKLTSSHMWITSNAQWAEWRCVFLYIGWQGHVTMTYCTSLYQKITDSFKADNAVW